MIQEQYQTGPEQQKTSEQLDGERRQKIQIRIDGGQMNQIPPSEIANLTRALDKDMQWVEAGGRTDVAEGNFIPSARDHLFTPQQTVDSLNQIGDQVETSFIMTAPRTPPLNPNETQDFYGPKICELA